MGQEFSEVAAFKKLYEIHKRALERMRSRVSNIIGAQNNWEKQNVNELTESYNRLDQLAERDDWSKDSVAIVTEEEKFTIKALESILIQK